MPCDLSHLLRGSRCSCFSHDPFQLVNSRVADLAGRLRELNCSRQFVLESHQRHPRRVRMDNPDAQTFAVIIATNLAVTSIHYCLLHYFDIAESGSPASVSKCSSNVHGRHQPDQRTTHDT